jgi:predicted transposase YbfD/YdcC
MSSSPIAEASVGLARRPLSEVFAQVPDPRKPRGVRHAVATVLTVAQCAVLAGARSLVAIAEWAMEADRDALSQHGIGADVVLPSESTIRRTLAVVDADGLDRLVAGWMATRVGRVAGRRVIAIDGKTMRGARRAGGAPHLVAALEHSSGAVIGQLAVTAKSNEIPALRDLLSGINIAGAVITADAMHCQRETARHITGTGGHYLLTVKANQRVIRDQLKALPWKDVPATSTATSSHGRRVRRTIKAVAAPDWVDFPGAAQVLQIRRTRTIKGRKHIEVVYAICSLSMTDAPPATVAAWIQGHWGIENKLHWVRDVVFDEDRHQLRTGHGPQVMATLRNTAISMLRSAGHSNIAAALRHHSRDSRRPIELIAAA